MHVTRITTIYNSAKVTSSTLLQNNQDDSHSGRDFFAIRHNTANAVAEGRHQLQLWLALFHRAQDPVSS